jgi:hypothetical protein
VKKGKAKMKALINLSLAFALDDTGRYDNPHQRSFQTDGYQPIMAKNFQAVKNEVDRVLSLAQNRGQIIVGTGCLPFETDPEMVLKTKNYIPSRNVL